MAINKFHWILDAGHGAINLTQLTTNSTHINGKIITSGKRSFKFPKGNQYANQCLIEGVVNREVLNYLTLLLAAENIKFSVLVPTFKDISLTARCTLANAIAKNSNLPCILVSIHHNAFRNEWNAANGVSSHYFKKGDRYSTAGKQYAEDFQKELVINSGLRDRGIKGNNFKMLRDTSMPAILTENGFMTNLVEAEYLMTEIGKQNTAKGHFTAIKNIELN